MSICSKEKLFREQPEARGALCGLPARPAQLFWRRRGFHELAAGEGGQERFLPSKFSVLGLNDCLLWALNGIPTRARADPSRPAADAFPGRAEASGGAERGVSALHELETK